MLSSKKLLAATALTALMPLSAYALDGVVDNFSKGQGETQCTLGVNPSLCVDGDIPPMMASSYVTDEDIRSGERDVKIEVVNPPQPSSFSNQGSVIISGGVFTWNNEAEALTKVTVQYDGPDGVGPEDTVVYDAVAPWDGLLLDGITDDYTDGGAANAFSVNVLQTDLGFDIMLTVVDGDGDVATVLEPAIGVAGVRTFAYANFEADNPLIDLDRVDAFQLMLTATGLGSVDLQFEGIFKIPEPATMALLVSGLFGLGASRRRKVKGSALPA